MSISGNTSYTGNMNKVVGGSDTEEGRYPYMISITFVSFRADTSPRNLQEIDKSDFFPTENGDPYLDTRRQIHNCGGSFITPQVILTAAHCLNNLEESRRQFEQDIEATQNVDFDVFLAIRLGCSDLRSQTCALLPLQSIAFNELYRSDRSGDDIGLIFLQNRVENIQTISLAGPNLIPKNGDQVRVIGWGRTLKSTVTPGTKLQQTTLTIAENDVCLKQQKHVFEVLSKVKDVSVIPDVFDNFDTVYCTTSDGNDSCNGDSGGPLMYSCDSDPRNDIEIGIVSSGVSCASDGPMSIFESVNSNAAINFMKREFQLRGLSFEDVKIINSLDSFCPGDSTPEISSPTPFPTFDITATWTCDPQFFSSNDGCDCGCGMPDPDCELYVLSNVTFGCEANETCSSGICVLVSDDRDEFLPTNEQIFYYLVVFIVAGLIALLLLVMIIVKGFKKEKQTNGLTFVNPKAEI